MKKWFHLILFTCLTTAPFAGFAEEGIEAAATNPQTLSVEIAFGTGVENHEVVGPAETFNADTPQVVAWTKILGAEQPTEVKHVWSCDGEEMGVVSLGVQSASFRTFSRKNINGKTGKWMVEVKDVNGNSLASKEFEVK